ncbi:unnamed protein product [Polarella glacialis]|uniref:Uncharacterized protein n=1 Tax=Polarella glacialis TaxID=89957 RepID=A0A813EUJ0_POLGL|nr:unnamed protein product [Polarella glacialis]
MAIVRALGLDFADHLSEFTECFQVAIIGSCDLRAFQIVYKYSSAQLLSRVEKAILDNTGFSSQIEAFQKFKDKSLAEGPCPRIIIVTEAFFVPVCHMIRADRGLLESDVLIGSDRRSIFQVSSRREYQSQVPE